MNQQRRMQELAPPEGDLMEPRWTNFTIKTALQHHILMEPLSLPTPGHLPEM